MRLQLDDIGQQLRGFYTRRGVLSELSRLELRVWSQIVSCGLVLGGVLVPDGVSRSRSASEITAKKCSTSNRLFVDVARVSCWMVARFDRSICLVL